MIYQLKLPAEAVDIVVQSLAAQPYGRVAKVIADITGQVEAQNAPPLRNTASDVAEEARANGNGA